MRYAISFTLSYADIDADTLISRFERATDTCHYAMPMLLTLRMMLPLP